MAVVTEYLFQLIAKQVEDRSLVVWYDPEQAYSYASDKRQFQRFVTDMTGVQAAVSATTSAPAPAPPPAAPAPANT